MDPNLAISKQIKDVNETIALCHRVKETIESKGWQEIVEPLIDKAINDILGAKVNGKWHGGLVDRARKDEKREYYIGYKQALIDLHTRVYAYVNSIPVYDDKRKALLKATDEPRYKTPMLDDSKYGKDVS